jgi:AraC family transcriptional regulator of adaptative response / DNA-3-methyladenine glycosylase II
LISGGALDDGNVETLAGRLGVTSRHLRRLFTTHLGASPLAVAHTQRLHFAKRLIDETSLPMSHIATAAGYGSIRRFNDAFQNTYGRPPRELRKAGDYSELAGRTATLTVRLPYRPPFDWTRLLAFFAGRATPGVESVTDDTYSRTLSFGGAHGVVEIRPDRRDGYLSLTLRQVNTNSLFEAVQTAREVFDLDAPISEITTALGRDKTLKKFLRKNPGVRVPGAWDGYELTIRAILGQQISVKAATTIAGRVAARYGEVFTIGDDVDDSQLNRLAAQDPDEFCESLKAIKGIGEWTAQYVAMRALKSPDAFPGSDLGLISAIAYPDRVTPKELLTRAEDWRPWRAYAAMLLWGSLPGSGG